MLTGDLRALIGALVLAVVWTVPTAAQEVEAAPSETRAAEVPAAEAPATQVPATSPRVEARPGGPAAATAEELAAELTSRFEVLPTRSGLLLRPLSDDADYRTVEVTDGEVAVDGELVDDQQLAARLGATAQAIRALADLPADEARTVVGLGSARSERPRTQVRDDAPAPPEPPAPPESPERPRRERGGRDVGERVSFASSVRVGEGEVAEVAVAVGGDVEVDGRVEQDAVAVGGDVEVDGQVEGNAVAVGGSVRLGPDAVVDGDVSSIGGRVQRDEGSRVGGNISEVSMGPGVWGPGFWGIGNRDHTTIWERAFRGRVAAFGEVVSSIVALVLLALLVWLVTLVARAPVERVAAKVEHDTLRCLIAGFLFELLFVPVLGAVVLVLTISIIGIPLLVLVPFVLLVLAVGLLLGYAGVARWTGHWLERRLGWKLDTPFLLVLVGVTAIQIWTIFAQGLDTIGGPLHLFAAILWTFGVVVKFLAWTIGLGAVLLTRFGAGPRPIEAAASVPPAPIPEGAAAPSEPPPPSPPPAPSEPPPNEADEDPETRR